MTVFANLRQRNKVTFDEEDEVNEIDESTKCLLKEKFRKVL
jgi:hypothetical protein